MCKIGRVYGQTLPLLSTRRAARRYGTRTCFVRPSQNNVTGTLPILLLNSAFPKISPQSARKRACGGNQMLMVCRAWVFAYNQDFLRDVTRVKPWVEYVRTEFRETVVPPRQRLNPGTRFRDFGLRGVRERYNSADKYCCSCPAPCIVRDCKCACFRLD